MECGNCKHWKRGAIQVVEDNDPSECRRFPKVPVVMGGEILWLYPMHRKYDLCGEHDQIYKGA